MTTIATQTLASRELLEYLENQVSDFAPDNYSLTYVTHPDAYKSAETHRFHADAQNGQDKVSADVLVATPTRQAIEEAVQLRLGQGWRVIDYRIPENNCPF